MQVLWEGIKNLKILKNEGEISTCPDPYDLQVPDNRFPLLWKINEESFRNPTKPGPIKLNETLLWFLHDVLGSCASNSEFGREIKDRFFF